MYLFLIVAIGLTFWLACADDDDDNDDNPTDDDTDDDVDDDADDDSGDDDISPPPGWRMEPVDDQGPFGDVRLRVASNGVPHLTFGVFPSGQDSMLKYAATEQGAWSVDTVWTFAQGGGYFALALRGDAPVIAYQRYIDIVAGLCAGPAGGGRSPLLSHRPAGMMKYYII